jgi:uncharacterized protein YbdZ (MbtH family)
MTEAAEPEAQAYLVVVNHEEQYSIWPVDQELPDGWRPEGTTGTKEACLSHIDEVWTDMRPLSLRQYMAEHADDELEELVPADADEPSLVDRLCAGSHPVEASLRPERTVEALKEAIDGGYVFVRFTDTRGGTEVGIRLDSADFTSTDGQVQLAGTLNLDFEDVRCSARIDLATLTGEGRLERVGAR